MPGRDAALAHADEYYLKTVAGRRDKMSQLRTMQDAGSPVTAVQGIVAAMTKKNFAPLKETILEALAERRLLLAELLAVPAVREQALRLHIRRSGVSPGRSAEITINECLLALRREGRIAYDRATSRWENVGDLPE